MFLEQFHNLTISSYMIGTFHFRYSTTGCFRLPVGAFILPRGSHDNSFDSYDCKNPSEPHNRKRSSTLPHGSGCVSNPTTRVQHETKDDVEYDKLHKIAVVGKKLSFIRAPLTTYMYLL